MLTTMKFYHLIEATGFYFTGNSIVFRIKDEGFLNGSQDRLTRDDELIHGLTVIRRLQILYQME